jgi:hypothetical protein
MFRRMMLRLTFLFAGVFLPDGSLVWAAEGIISKVANPSGTTCNLKFPAIKEETLYWDRPVLKDPTDAILSTSTGTATTILSGKNRWRVKGLSISTSCAYSVVATDDGARGSL